MADAGTDPSTGRDKLASAKSQMAPFLGGVPAVLDQTFAGQDAIKGVAAVVNDAAQGNLLAAGGDLVNGVGQGVRNLLSDIGIG